jgi:hypothetical protein
MSFDELLDVACGHRDVLATFRHGSTQAPVHRTRPQSTAQGAR